MSFRTRLALVAAAAVALAVVASSFVVYFVVKDQLYGTIDSDLRGRRDPRQRAAPEIPRFTNPRFGLVGGTTQVVSASGASSPGVLPVTPVS